MPERGDRCRELNELNIFSASLWVILRLVLTSASKISGPGFVFPPIQAFKLLEKPYGFILALHWLAQCLPSSFLHSFIDTANFCWHQQMTRHCAGRGRLDYEDHQDLYPWGDTRVEMSKMWSSWWSSGKTPCSGLQRAWVCIPGQETKILRCCKIPRVIKILLIVRLSPCHLSRRIFPHGSPCASYLGQVQTQSRAHLWHLLSDRLCHPLRRVNWAFQATLAGSTGRNNRNTALPCLRRLPLPMPPLPAAPGLRIEEGWGWREI